MSVWLPFLNTYRTMCLAPHPDFRRVLEEIRALRKARIAIKALHTLNLCSQALNQIAAIASGCGLMVRQDIG